MMRRILCLLLIPSMLASQGLCWAHVHPGDDGAGHGEHGTRPHFHVGDHEHDHGQVACEVDSHSECPGQIRSEESETNLPIVLLPLGDHDADAVYCDEPANFTSDSDSVNRLAADCVDGVIALHLVHQDDMLPRVGTARGRPFSVFGTACPIFLRVLSLRI